MGKRKIIVCTVILLFLFGGGSAAGFFGYDGGDILRRLGFQLRRVGDVIDMFNGVAVYYNGPVSNVSGRNLAPDGYNLGQKHQCVEFVKRYYYEALHHKMPDAYGHAKDFFDPDIADGGLNPARDLRQYVNGGTHPPAVGDLLVFGASPVNAYGHVAIICAVR